jgi:hypothetical protein
MKIDIDVQQDDYQERMQVYKEVLHEELEALDDYKFDDKKHVHTLGGRPLCGVTTVLSVISKPALIQWAANMAVEYLSEHIGEAMEYPLNPHAIDEVFKAAKVAHKTKKEKAGDWGTQLHDAIEQWIKHGTEPTLESFQKEAFDKFKTWATDNKVEFLESEKHVWSRKYWMYSGFDFQNGR